jgi:AraC family transcriptional regulator of adaptative response / DNA-3-methyladenine glycosylase II
VRRSGFGATRLFELFRRHLHATPADILLAARVAQAKTQLLSSDAGLVEIASRCGFESQSVFHDHFLRATGLTPGAYRDLRDRRHFAVRLPKGYAVGYLHRALGRDPQSATERLEGNRCRAAIQLSGGPALLNLVLSKDHVDAEVSNGSAVEAHGIVAGLLGLGQDAAGFVRLARRLGLERLVAGREGLRISQVPGVYEGLLWSIIGQQVNFAFACTLRRRLVERAGKPIGEGLVATPTPAAVAALSIADLTPLQFSTQKAGYLIGVSRMIEDGRLDLEQLRIMSPTRAERTLLAVRGLGPWAVNYVMMRALGFADCVPLGDTGVTSGLTTLFSLEAKPDTDAVRRLMSVFSPYRSLATAHLWQLNKPAP